MAKLIIEGGHALAGELKVSGNKNAALPMLAACLLTDDEVVLRNLPLIQDVRVMLDILAGLGVSVQVKGNTARLCAAGVTSGKPDPQLCRKVRGSILFAGPLLTRVRKIVLPAPGGDVIGQRRLDTHFHGFSDLGVRAKHKKNLGFELSRTELIGADILLEEASVTATENVVMAAIRAKGKTILFNAACEPHVQDLCSMLVRMGAKIEGIGTNRLIIRGVKKLRGCSYQIGPDYIEAASYLAAAAATGGKLTVTGMNQPFLEPIITRGFRRLGVKIQIKGSRWTVDGRKAFAVNAEFGPSVPKIEDGIWPAIPSDLMSVLIVLATQARGSILFFEKMFESRMYFVDRLIEMGAHIVPCDPHRVVVSGPIVLRGGLVTSPDIRAGMALVIAALCAKGTTTIDNAEMIDRGYRDIDARLQSLGAKVRRTE